VTRRHAAAPCFIVVNPSEATSASIRYDDVRDIGRPRMDEFRSIDPTTGRVLAIVPATGGHDLS
jgi:hypothetical protein